MGSRGDEQGGKSVQHVRAPTGGRDTAGCGRGGGRTARCGRRPPHEDRLAAGAAARDGRLAMPDPPLRGRRGRDRRIAERVATDFAARHAGRSPETEVDFDVATVDAEVEDARRATPAAPERPAAARPGGTPPVTGRKGAGHRLPHPSALPPLLAATGTFASLRQRLAAPADAEAGPR